MAGTTTNYPAGPYRPATVRGEAILQVHTGQVFWVYSGTALTKGTVAGSNSGPGTFARPFATLAYACTQCVANRGDVIFIKPGHTETLTAAGTVTLSAAATSVIGVGNYNTRPKLTLGTIASATFLISGANCYVSNLWMMANLTNVVTAFDVTGVGATIDNIRFTNGGTDLDFLRCITASGADNSADGMTVSNCNWTTIDTDDLSMINFVGSAKDVNIHNNQMVTASTAATQFAAANLINVQTGKLLLNADIGWNRVQGVLGDSAEVFMSCDGTTHTGIVHNNYVQCTDTTGAIDLGADVTGFGLFNNMVATTNVLSGGFVPAIDVNL